MSDVKLIPGKPIGMNILRTAIQVLGFDPDHVKGVEVSKSTIEASYGDSTYSSHKIVEDPWAEPDARFLVIDTDVLQEADREELRAYLGWFIQRHRKGAPPF